MSRFTDPVGKGKSNGVVFSGWKVALLGVIISTVWSLLQEDTGSVRARSLRWRGGSSVVSKDKGWASPTDLRVRAGAALRVIVS